MAESYYMYATLSLILAVILFVAGMVVSEKWASKVVPNLLGVLGILLFITFIGFFTEAKRIEHGEDIYSDVKAVILAINDSETFITQDKFHRPMACSSILFRSIDQGYMFQVSCSDANTQDLARVVSPSWVYSHSVGDTVLFTQIRKSRTFFSDRYPHDK
jgi:hypothetical protein